MSDTEIELLSKKVDKTLNLVTKIAKTLHLIPVTEKEEREIQILQRKNLAQAAKINSELNAMQNQSDGNDVDNTIGVQKVFDESEAQVYDGIIGNDIMDIPAPTGVTK